MSLREKQNSGQPEEGSDELLENSDSNQPTESKKDQWRDSLLQRKPVLFVLSFFTPRPDNVKMNITK